MSSPAPLMDGMMPPVNDPLANMPSRMMRVKVLYTFDADDKTNCLARLRELQKIPLLPIDDEAQVGVIELRQCIQAVVDHSPEIISRLSQGDFTIYAFDYSECNTPQVGQGMLSSLLAAPPASLTALDLRSRMPITGRVSQNVMAALNGDVSDTLEVKLRLVPVPKPVQQDFIKSLDIYRNMSPAMSGGFDPNAWADSLVTENAVIANLEQRTRTYEHQRHMSNASAMGRPILPRQPSRPSSRISMRSEGGRQRHDSSLDVYAEEGPAKKRAKITQTDWRGKSSFGSNADSLRVTASTAASIRVHKPVATRPDLGASLEPPPRVPTPVPRDKSNSRFQGQPYLRRESSLYQMESPYDNQSDAAMSSPEDMQDPQEESPVEFPSSPPAMPEPSSPGLPPYTRALDSGYMSGGLTESLLDDEDRPITKEDRRQAARCKSRERSKPVGHNFIEQTPGPPELLPTKMNTSRAPDCDAHTRALNSISNMNRRQSLASTSRPELSAQPSNPSELNATTPQPTTDHQVAAAPPRISAPPRSAAASPAPSESLAFGGKPRSGSGAKRKKIIQDKLLSSLASGDMPPYCQHCGAIETPTWRSLHTRIVEGAPTAADYAEREDETIGIDVLEKDEFTEQILKYRIIKSVRQRKKKDMDKEGFTYMQVCNPCGLWFNKFKHMRPEERWKVSRPRKAKNKDNLMSDAGDLNSDCPMSSLWTDQPQAEDQIAQEQGQSRKSPSEEPQEESQMEMVEKSSQTRPRASSVQAANRQPPRQKSWVDGGFESALQRAIQSSPARFVGTQESPIELDDDVTPKPTRRLLFPSPRKEGEVKSLEDGIHSKGSGNKSAHAPAPDTVNAQVNVLQSEKENLPPLSTLLEGADTVDMDFSALFDTAMFKTPSKQSAASATAHITPPSKSIATFESLLATPTPSKRTATLTNRTPTRMDAFLPSFSSSEKRLLGTPSRYMPLASPSRRSVSGTSARAGQTDKLPPLTPFTRQLREMLEDAPANLTTGGTDGDDGIFHLFSPGGLGIVNIDPSLTGGWENITGRALDFGTVHEQSHGVDADAEKREGEGSGSNEVGGVAEEGRDCHTAGDLSVEGKGQVEEKTVAEEGQVKVVVKIEDAA